MSCVVSPAVIALPVCYTAYGRKMAAVRPASRRHGLFIGAPPLCHNWVVSMWFRYVMDTAMALPNESTTTPPRPRRALVVEDEPHIRELVTLHLGLEGLHVTESGAGDDAIRRIESESFDVVVLDLMLPRVDGLTVCRAIRREPKNADVPILMLTAKREESDKVLGLETGADDYLSKP